MFAAKHHLNGHTFCTEYVAITYSSSSTLNLSKPIKTNNGDIHVLQKEIQCHAAGQLSARHNPWLTFGAGGTDSSPLGVRKHFAMWSFKGCQEGFLGPHFGKQWHNNLSPWQHLANLTHQNRNVKVLGKQVSHSSLPKTCWFFLFSLC